MEKYYFIFVSILFVFLQACVPPPKTELENRDSPFFDLKAFVKEQSELLESQNKKVHKTLTIHGETEQTTLEKMDWNKELILIVESDINKAVLYDVYQVDSTESKISYTTKDKMQKVKEITISKSGEEISQIEVKFEEQNLIYHSARQMTLALKEGLINEFTIIGYQKVVTDDTLQYKLVDKLIE
jgi:hypothetical protein